MRFIHILAFLLAGISTAVSQPLYEMRAVWLTTAIGLDWPDGVQGAAAQEASLRSAIRRIAAKNLNTVVFQVVPRADAFYESARLPWSPVLTGTAGTPPGFDPLAVAVDEAHANGLELHAWYNVFRSQKMTTIDTGPGHVTETFPEFTEKNGEWLNPGYPGVNKWIIENLLEIVENYDIDGIQFDFARYDDGGYLRDDSLFAVNNPDNIGNKFDWRRNNVNRFMQDASAAILAAKPWIKIGSTPIGNYDESCFPGAFTGYDRVFQDSRLWLQEGYNDYLAPQLYWADSNQNSPSFTCLVNDWVGKKGTSRHIYAGVGLYMTDVQAEIGSQIDISRSDGADGVVFFREQHTRGEDFEGRFDLPSLRPAIPLRFEATAPTVPGGLSLLVDPEDRVINFSWLPADGSESDPVGWYLVLRSTGGEPDLQNPENHRALVYSDRQGFTDVLSDSETGPFTYAVVAISRLGLESDPSETLTTDAIPTAVQRESPAAFNLGFAYPNPARDRVTLTIRGAGRANLTARVIDQTGRVVWRTAGTLTASLVIETDRFSAGTYYLEVTSGGRRATRTFVLVR